MELLEELESAETVGLVTTYTGNFRAVWETDESCYFAVEFYDGESCECVMWYPATQPASRSCPITESIVVSNTTVRFL